MVAAFFSPICNAIPHNFFFFWGINLPATPHQCKDVSHTWAWRGPYSAFDEGENKNVFKAAPIGAWLFPFCGAQLHGIAELRRNQTVATKPLKWCFLGGGRKPIPTLFGTSNDFVAKALYYVGKRDILASKKWTLVANGSIEEVTWGNTCFVTNCLGGGGSPIRWSDFLYFFILFWKALWLIKLLTVLKSVFFPLNLDNKCCVLVDNSFGMGFTC